METSNGPLSSLGCFFVLGILESDRGVQNIYTRYIKSLAIGSFVLVSLTKLGHNLWPPCGGRNKVSHIFIKAQILN